MHRHEHDGIGVIIVIIDVRNERNFFEKIRKRAFGVLLLKTAQVGSKLLHVRGAVFCGFRVVGLKKIQVIDALHKLVIKLAERDFFVVVELDESLHLCGEKRHFVCGTGQCRIVFRVRDDLKQCLTRLLTDLRRDFDRAVANAALRRVDDAAQAHFITRIVDNAQICDHLADLTALVEARAAYNSMRYAGLCKIAFKCQRL